MRRLLATYAVIFAALIGAWQCLAQVPMTGAGLGKPTAAASYTGPLDVISGAIAYWGFRCSNAAYSGNVADITDSSTGNTTGTRLQCSNGVVSALVSASACTFVTGNACSSVASTCAVACNILNLYGQVGTEGTATQATNANRPVYTQSAVNSKPCMTVSGGQVLVDASSWGTAGATGAPYSTAAVGERTGNTGALNGLMGDATSLGFIGFNNSANQAAIFDGTNVISGAANDGPGAFHSLQGLYNGASSKIVIDGSSSTTGAAGGTVTWTGSPTLGAASSGTFPLAGVYCEGMFWNGDKSASFGTLSTNQLAYY